MTENWEIVAGDFGGSYKAIVEELDLSACTAKIKVWRDSTLLIDGKACSVVTYDEEADESYCYYDVVDGDFPLTAAVEGKRTNYKVMVEFTKIIGEDTVYKEHDLGFEWIVVPAPPSS